MKTYQTNCICRFRNGWNNNKPKWNQSMVSTPEAALLPWYISTIYRKMKCFKHREENAVGLCKSCGRSLCPDCYTEVGDSLCCKGKCEEKVRILNSMIEKNSQILSTSNQAMKSAAKFSLMMGILFMGFGAWHLSNDRGSLSYFLLAACRT